MTAPAVAVLGAGPAGAACAIALARADVGPVRLVETPRRRGNAVGETIPPGARPLLARLGLWSAFAVAGHARCPGSYSAWGSDVIGHNDFLLDPQGSGWHLDRARFDGFLRRAAKSAGVQVVARRPDSLSGATFVVDATGAASAHAKAQGARQLSLDRLIFVYGFFETAGAASMSGMTLLEAAPDGWWYAAPLPQRRLAVAFVGDADHVRSTDLARPGPWLSAALATRHLARRLAGCRFIPGSLTPRVAHSFRLDRVAGPRWAAVGDAATCYDPLAGQGITKALHDGIDAAAAIGDALASGSELGDAYSRAVGARFEEYVANRNHFYALEERWPGSEFWRRRQTRLGVASPSLS